MAKKYPLETFAPEMMDALIKGSRQRIILPFPSHTLGKRFQLRLHMLRATMQRSAHPHYPIAAKARVTIYRPSDDPRYTSQNHKFHFHLALLNLSEEEKARVEAVVVIEPQDVEFRDMLSRAGISTGDGQEASVASSAPHAATPHHDFMQDLASPQVVDDEKSS